MRDSSTGPTIRSSTCAAGSSGTAPTYINRTNYPFHFNREREPPEIEANYTLYMYEALRAIKQACEAVRLGSRARGGDLPRQRRAIDRIARPRVRTTYQGDPSLTGNSHTTSPSSCRSATWRSAGACGRSSGPDITKHPNKNFNIRVIEDETAFRFAYVMHIVAGIKRALDEGRKRYVLILPAPNPHYAFVAKMINDLNIPCHHVHTFNMDEYADQDGNTAPRSWAADSSIGCGTTCSTASSRNCGCPRARSISPPRRTWATTRR